METTIDIFGFLYFIFYILQFLVFYFFFTAEYISGTVVVVGFGIGIVFWYINLIYYSIFYIFQNDREKKKYKTSYIDCIFLFWTTILPTIYFLFREQILLQIWYILIFIIVAIENIWEYQFYRKTTKTIFRPESLQIISVGLLVLIPTIYIYTEPISVLFYLAVAVFFGRLIIGDILEEILYILRLFERIEIVRDWRPNLYGIRLIWIWYLVEFFKSVLEAAIDYLYWNSVENSCKITRRSLGKKLWSMSFLYIHIYHLFTGISGLYLSVSGIPVGYNIDLFFSSFFQSIIYTIYELYSKLNLNFLCKSIENLWWYYSLSFRRR